MYNYRIRNFLSKFESACNYLGASSKDIISLKVRDISSLSYRYYDDFLQELAIFFNGSINRHIAGNFQGDAHLIENNNQKILIVQHETGLEILFIASSIASLLSLIPTTLQIWNYFRRDKGDIELRYFNKQGELIEEKNILYSNIKPYNKYFENGRPISGLYNEYTMDIDKIMEYLKDIKNDISEIKIAINKLTKLNN
jgi:hypothetical protein